MDHKIKTFIIIFCFTFLSFCNAIYADTITEAIQAVVKNDYATIKKMRGRYRACPSCGEDFCLCQEYKSNQIGLGFTINEVGKKPTFKP